VKKSNVKEPKVQLMLSSSKDLEEIRKDDEELIKLASRMGFKVYSDYRTYSDEVFPERGRASTLMLEKNDIKIQIPLVKSSNKINIFTPISKIYIALEYLKDLNIEDYELIDASHNIPAFAEDEHIIVRKLVELDRDIIRSILSVRREMQEEFKVKIPFKVALLIPELMSMAAGFIDTYLYRKGYISHEDIKRRFKLLALSYGDEKIIKWVIEKHDQENAQALAKAYPKLPSKEAEELCREFPKFLMNMLLATLSAVLLKLATEHPEVFLGWIGVRTRTVR
jgi:hypothetical protein